MLHDFMADQGSIDVIQAEEKRRSSVPDQACRLAHKVMKVFCGSGPVVAHKEK